MAADPKSRPTKDLALTDEFTKALGLFYGLWATTDLTTDFAIYKFLKVTPEEAHLITAGMMFGRKARLLADLIGKSDHPKRSELLASFNAIRGKSKREIFAHGYLWSDANSVKFLERSISGEFKATEHSFTMLEFMEHLAEFAYQTAKFYEALGASKAEISAFANAAFNLNRKPKTSPGAPKDRA